MSTTGLAEATRLVIDAELRPQIGSAFQPTGFPNLGAALFERPGQDGKVVLIESVQSVANLLEAVGWPEGSEKPLESLGRLPYVEVRDPAGAFLTSSRLASHRLADAYVRDAKTEADVDGRDWLTEELGLVAGRPIDWAMLYRALFRLDPLCLLHGVFFSDPKFHGNPKVRRAISALIEGEDARPAVSGGLKRDDVTFNKDKEAARTSKEGYGFVPFGRTEYTARTIRLSAVIDLQQIRGYGLDSAETELLIDIAQWELRRLLDDNIRRRTACDLEVVSVRARRPEGVPLATTDELADAISGSQVEFDGPLVHTLTWGKKGK